MAERGVHDLNRIIKDEEVLIESYARMIHDVKDPVLKDHFRSIQENHFKQMMVFSDRVLELNGEPRFDTGRRGISEDICHYNDICNDITDLETARIALKVERKGAEKLATYDFNDIDTKLHELHHEALRNETENIKTLEEYIRRSEIQ